MDDVLAATAGGEAAALQAAAVEREAIVSSRRFNPSREAQRGEMRALKPGTYYLVWDNSFSLLTSKTLTYNVRVRAAREGSPTLAVKAAVAQSGGRLPS